MQVGEERLVLAEAVVLLGDRLLDLEEEVGGGPDLVGGGEDLRPGCDVLLVRDGGAGPGVLLDDDLVAVADELVHAGRRDRHAELVVLDFAGDADLHVDHGPWLRGLPGHSYTYPDRHYVNGDTANTRGRASLMKGFVLSSLTKH